eukprot:COSAG01_NODE_778_length_13681_cov_15.265130_5_plen_171_part_00
MASKWRARRIIKASSTRSSVLIMHIRGVRTCVELEHRARDVAQEGDDEELAAHPAGNAAPLAELCAELVGLHLQHISGYHGVINVRNANVSQWTSCVHQCAVGSTHGGREPEEEQRQAAVGQRLLPQRGLAPSRTAAAAVATVDRWTCAACSPVIDCRDMDYPPDLVKKY